MYLVSHESQDEREVREMKDKRALSLCRVDRHVKEPELRKMRRGDTQGRRCHKTGKIRYRDVEEAKRALQQSMIQAARETEEFGETKRLEARVYRCYLCSRWHLSSQEDKFPSAEVYRA